MGHEDDGAVGLRGDGEVEVGVAGVGSATPQSQRRAPPRSMGMCWLTRTGMPLLVRAPMTAGAPTATSWLPRMAKRCGQVRVRRISAQWWMAWAEGEEGEGAG